MNWLVLAFALQLAYTPSDSATIYKPPVTVSSAQSEMLIDMDAELRAWNFLYVGGSVGVPTWIDKGWTIPGFTLYCGFPNALQSVIRAGVRFGGVEIGWSHLCTHPVMPFQPILNEQTFWEGSYDEFHIKFSGTVKLF
jgi:hypothetical protein